MARDALSGLRDLCRRVLVKHLNMTTIAGPVECLLIDELDYRGAGFVLDRRNFGKQFGRFPCPCVAVSTGRYTSGSRILLEQVGSQGRGSVRGPSGL